MFVRAHQVLEKENRHIKMMVLFFGKSGLCKVNRLFERVAQTLVVRDDEERLMAFLRIAE